MSDTTDALGRALHYAGQNIDRTTLGVAIRRLEASGYRIVPVTTPQFHVQPAGVHPQPATGGNQNLGEAVQTSKDDTKEGSGRV